MKDFEKIFKAFANRRRLAIIKYLKNHKEASVGEIAGEIGLSFKATSKHLGILAGIDVIDREQRSLQMFYRLAPNRKPFISTIINLL